MTNNISSGRVQESESNFSAVEEFLNGSGETPPTREMIEGWIDENSLCALRAYEAADYLDPVPNIGSWLIRNDVTQEGCTSYEVRQAVFWMLAGKLVSEEEGDALSLSGRLAFLYEVMRS